MLKNIILSQSNLKEINFEACDNTMMKQLALWWPGFEEPIIQTSRDFYENTLEDATGYKWVVMKNL